MVGSHGRVSRRTANQACCRDLPRPPHVPPFALRVFAVVVIQPSFHFPKGGGRGAPLITSVFVFSQIFFSCAASRTSLLDVADDEKSFALCDFDACGATRDLIFFSEF